MPDGLGAAAKHQPLRLEPDDIVFSAQAILGGVKSDELHALMPSPNPYGYLVLLIAGQSQIFSLVEDETSIGRSAECHIVIPDSFGSVSRHHCDIIRTTRGVRLRDAESANGTFLGGKRVRKDIPLSSNNRFVLGSAAEAQGSCALTFYFAADKPFVPQRTSRGETNMP
jgi:pSer/pThr/pTyr-binding forkhead associated (FHA) protein